MLNFIYLGQHILVTKEFKVLENVVGNVYNVASNVSDVKKVFRNLEIITLLLMTLTVIDK